MKLVGRDDKGNPIWKPDNWKDPKEEQPKEQKTTKKK